MNANFSFKKKALPKKSVFLLAQVFFFREAFLIKLFLKV